ncbi:MAG: DUF2971 domain-containing protein [Deltaproteobacteria bacterium]|nr:DUF2971 domain-containing protein [Deltaproteobacteria bacterium]
MSFIRKSDFSPLPKKRNSKLWRYIDFPKFESLIQKKTLYFASAKEFTDTFEGSITQPDQQIWKQEMSKLQLDQLHYISQKSIAFEKLRGLTKINCWHLSEHESDAMWKIYLQQEKGIALQTTISRFFSALKPYRLQPEYDDEIIWIGKVQYLDYRKEPLPSSSMLDRFFCKKRSFAYESEVRAVISLRTAEEFGVRIPDEGIFVPVDCSRLIQRIYIAPGLEPNFYQKIKVLLEKNNLNNIPIEQSELDDKAVY